MKIKEVAFIGYPVTDIARSRHFYEAILGLGAPGMNHEISGSDGKFWIEYAVGGSTFAISNAWEPSGQSGPSVAFEVENLEQSIAEIKAAGVTILMETMESPGCRMTIIADPDGNSLTLHQRKPWNQ